MLSLEGLKFNDAYVELSDIMTKEEFQTLFDNMVRAGLIVSDKGPVLKEEKKEEITLNGLTLMIIQECNLRCTYCYGEGGEYQDRGKMSLETAKKSIDFLIGNSKNKELLICFLGGEPLMNFPLIKDVVAYCNKYEMINRFILSIRSLQMELFGMMKLKNSYVRNTLQSKLA